MNQLKFDSSKKIGKIKMIDRRATKGERIEYENLLFDRLSHEDNANPDWSFDWTISFERIWLLYLTIRNWRYHFRTELSNIARIFGIQQEVSLSKKDAHDLIKRLQDSYIEGIFTRRLEEIQDSEKRERERLIKEATEYEKKRIKAINEKRIIIQKSLDDFNNVKSLEENISNIRNDLSSSERNNWNNGDNNSSIPPGDDDPRRREESIRNAIDTLKNILYGNWEDINLVTNNNGSLNNDPYWISQLLLSILEKGGWKMAFEAWKGISSMSFSIGKSLLAILENKQKTLRLYPCTLDLIQKANSPGLFPIILDDVVAEFKRNFSSAVVIYAEQLKLGNLHKKCEDLPVKEEELIKMIDSLPKIRFSELFEMYSLLLITARYSHFMYVDISLSVESDNRPKTTLFRSFRVDSKRHRLTSNKPHILGIRKIWLKWVEGNEIDMLLFSESRITILDSKFVIDMDGDNVQDIYIHQAIRYARNLWSLLQDYKNRPISIEEKNIRNNLYILFPTISRLTNNWLCEELEVKNHRSDYISEINPFVDNILAVGHLTMFQNSDNKFFLWTSSKFPKLRLFNFFSDDTGLLNAIFPLPWWRHFLFWF
ncbi:MAG: hypothetical protein ACD_71C00235G0002 [uncultured bacterium (gcode 4)]|uniref:Uncharacterized protein n=1 Tax=uncultured bacterium (gcode 4) TaxID=1234023 RepID=K1YMB1_9BACT|nr:MAG: hypothetical protein ACD_71C00235G0002 [uncultured bacterium (gcode 4)]